MAVKTGLKQLSIQPGAKIDPKSKGNPRSMRCPKCVGRTAVEVPDGKGGTVLQCPNCRSQFGFSKM